MRTNGVRSLLMGGQACILYGGAEFSRVTDLVLLGDDDNLRRFQSALLELQAETIAVPPFHKSHLDLGLAVHFRCRHPDAAGMRVDVMTNLRGVADFEILWSRRTTFDLESETLEVLGLSLLVWSLEISVYVLVGKAFGLGVPAHGMALVMCVLTLGLTAPSAPAFVGVFEGLVVAAIGVYGVGDPLAPAFAVAMHIIHFLPGTLLGAVASWRLGLKVKELRGAAPLARSLSSSS